MSATTATGRRLPPDARGHLVLGSMRDFQRAPLEFLEAVARNHGDMVRYRMANMIWFQVNHPDGVRRILQENNRNFGKGTLSGRILKPLLGEGLIISEGATWLTQRRLMQPVFHRHRVAGFGELMTRNTLDMLQRWEHLAETETPMDVAAEMSRLTLDIVTESLFSSHVGDEPGIIGRAVTTLVGEVSHRFEVPMYPPMRVPTPRNRRMKAALDTLDRAVYRIIEDRKLGGGGGDDLLALLMDARDAETGEAMDKKQLRDEILTLFIAGHETTANALSWAFYLLARHPEAEERLLTEVGETLGADESRRAPTMADLPRLGFTRRVIDETLRLYPPAWITNRQALADDEVCGYHVPAGTIVMISPYVLHRHPGFWETPERFDPDRFSPERSAGRPRFAYFPFGGGPRQCIGRDMALIEAQLVLATVVRRFRLRLSPEDRTVEAQALASLRPRGGLWMTLHEARKTASGESAM